MGDHPLSLEGRGLVVAIGKAAGPMLEGAQALLGGGPCGWLCVTKDHHPAPPGAEVFFAGHPVPDERSVLAAEAVLQRAAALGPRDWLLLLLSGGASALACAPVDGVSLRDKQQLTARLLSSGLDIQRCNLVRKALSRFKGGGLLSRSAARPVALVLSDVISGELTDVGSGPLAAPVSPRLAKQILQDASLWEGSPAAIKDHLERAPEPPMIAAAPHLLLGDRRLLLEGARQALLREGIDCQTLSEGFSGSVEALVERFSIERATLGAGRALLVVGEPTLTVRGPGLGGRAQHTAWQMAKLLQGDDALSFSAFASDGTDGPTQSAGAIVDGSSWRLCREGGVDPDAALSQFDSHRAHRAAGSLLSLGATGTNVNDLYLLLRRQGAA